MPFEPETQQGIELRAMFRWKGQIKCIHDPLGPGYESPLRREGVLRIEANGPTHVRRRTVASIPVAAVADHRRAGT